MKLLNILFFVSIGLGIISAQEEEISVDFGAGKTDTTLCFAYGFVPGDTLVYNVFATDSISIDYETPLRKERYHRIFLVCDSATSDGRFHLTQALDDFISKESKGAVKDVERNVTMWSGRRAGFCIDSSGLRHSFWVDDSTAAAITPGGSFEPFLVNPLAAYCKMVGETWNNYSYTYKLPENGVPVSGIRQSALFQNTGLVDTLGKKCIRLDFVKTAQGSVLINSPGQDGNGRESGVQMMVTTIISSHSILDLGVDYKVPVHFYTTQEQKLKVKGPDFEKPGYHYTNIYYTLFDIRKANRP